MVFHTIHCLESSQHGKPIEYTQGFSRLIRCTVYFRQPFHWYALQSPIWTVPDRDLGVVVESFYYVFQMTGGAKEITREEMRAFIQELVSEWLVLWLMGLASS